MREPIFIDTNILLYAAINDESEKHLIANQLLKDTLFSTELYISFQVLNEFYSNALKKKMPHETIQKIIAQYLKQFNVIPLEVKLLKKTFYIVNRYHFSYWDSLIIAAALEADCSILYSEDMQDGQLIENTLTIKNPFMTQDK